MDRSIITKKMLASKIALTKQLINGLNDKGRLGEIQYILAMYKGSQNITRISPHDYLKPLPTQNKCRGSS